MRDVILLRLAIRGGAKVNEPGRGGRLPLGQALTTGWPKLVDELLKAGADPVLPGDGGVSPLSQAMKKEQWNLVELMLTHAREDYVLKVAEIVYRQLATLVDGRIPEPGQSLVESAKALVKSRCDP